MPNFSLLYPPPKKNSASVFSIFSDLIFNKKKAKEDYEEYIKNDENMFIYMNKTENTVIKDNNKYNVSEEVEKSHKYEKFKFENAKIYTENGMSYFEFDAINLSYVPATELPDNIMIGFLDKKGKEFYTATYELPKIKIGETKHEKIEYPYDISNSYDFKFYLWG